MEELLGLGCAPCERAPQPPRTTTLDVEATDTIRNIKTQILYKEGIPTVCQELHFAGKRLEDDKRLQEYICSIQRVYASPLRVLLLVNGRPRTVEVRVHPGVEFVDAVDSPRGFPILPLPGEAPTTDEPHAGTASGSPTASAADGSTMPPVGQVRSSIDMSQCVMLPYISIDERAMSALFRQCKFTASRAIGNRPFYIGVAVNAARRWTLGEDPHYAHYGQMVVLLQACSNIVVDLEVLLIAEFTGSSMMVNRVGGGGGLSRHHPVSHLYICIQGDATRESIAMSCRGRRIPGWCPNVLCLGRCERCCSRW